MCFFSYELTILSEPLSCKQFQLFKASGGEIGENGKPRQYQVMLVKNFLGSLLRLFILSLDLVLRKVFQRGGLFDGIFILFHQYVSLFYTGKCYHCLEYLGEQRKPILQETAPMA
jgi:hypothetical protein